MEIISKIFAVPTISKMYIYGHLAWISFRKYFHHIFSHNHFDIKIKNAMSLSAL